MVNYKNGKIYKLVNDELNLTYYGSTSNEIRKRLNEHKSRAKVSNNCTSHKLFESGICKIYLVEKFPCEDKIELSQRERFYIENNECVNKFIPGRTKKEYHQDYKEIIAHKAKIYNQKNKAILAQKAKEYYQNNIEEKKQKAREYKQNNKHIAKEWYQNNKEIILQKQKEWYQNNKEETKQYQKEYRQKNLQKAREYRQNNKEKIAHRKKEYYQKNKQKNKQVIE